jgi:hypothetical protein
MTRDRWIDTAWFLAVALATSAWCVTAEPHLGATFDEPTYVDQGLKAWRSGSLKQLMTWGVMPLPVDVQTLPLYVWERWRGEPFDAYADLPHLLPVARAAMLPFWWLLLLYGMRWGRLLGGPWAGRLACGFIGFDPNLLGHAALAATDICLSATVLVATYHFLSGREARWFRRVVVPGLLYGVALTAKASALPYVPLLAILFGLIHLYQTNRLSLPGTGPLWGRVQALWTATTRLRWDVVYIFWIGIVYVFAYCGCDWQLEPTFIKWAQQLPDGDLKRVMLPLSENLPIFTNAGEGLIQQIKHNIRGHHGSYLLGEQHPRAVWYYFPTALSIKLAEPTLALVLVLLITRPRALASPAGWAVLLLLLFSLNTRVQIGVRLLYPLVAFLHIALAVACASGTGRWRRIGLGAGWLAMLASGLIAMSYWPDGLRHTNHLWGDPARGYERLTDSNYDWGQGLPDLADWWAVNSRPRLYVWYYGTDPAVYHPPFSLVQIHLFPNPDSAGGLVGGAYPALNPGVREAVERIVGEHYLAVGVSLLYGTPDRRPEWLALVAWLKTQEPVGRTRTFLIYKLR